MVGTRERASPADSKLQDLHNTGQQQNNWEESQWGSNIGGVTEARDLKLDLKLIAMNICKWRWVDRGQCGTHCDIPWRWVDRGIYCGTHCDIPYFHEEMFSYTCVCVCHTIWRGLQEWQKWKDREISRNGVHDVKQRINKTFSLKTLQNVIFSVWFDLQYFLC